MIKGDIEERTGQLKKEEMLVKDTEHSLNLQTKMFSGLKTKLDSELESVIAEQVKYNSRLKK